jgi:hypothetical protein
MQSATMLPRDIMTLLRHKFTRAQGPLRETRRRCGLEDPAAVDSAICVNDTTHRVDRGRSLDTVQLAPDLNGRQQ